MPVYRLGRSLAFPPPGMADPEGLLAVGGDLGVRRLTLAYSQGIFPWYDEESPILWWSPDPRFALLPAEFRVPASLRRVVRAGRFEVTFDRDFRAVIGRCRTIPRKDQAGTWITPEMQAAYGRMHDAGLAHSVEVRQEGRLVGGLYGVALGGAYFGESMFAEVNDASKVGFVTLMGRLVEWGFTLIDCQMPTDHLRRFGAREMPRPEFLERLRAALANPTRQGKWDADPPASGPAPDQA